MGASKRIMELVLLATPVIDTSTARFANVAFSDGSLLHGFNQRMLKRQPISAPEDVRRYFVTQEESGQLCLMAALLGGNGEIFFPKQSEELSLTTFSSIAERYLEWRGYTPYRCSSEDEARGRAGELIGSGSWPCYFFTSDTTGEKDYEEFYTPDEQVDLARFHALGVVQQEPLGSSEMSESTKELEQFLQSVQELRRRQRWTKDDLVNLISSLVPTLKHKETGKYLDDKM
jgi:FlaA1/EpsC-like NDP-sugar epimerase